MNALNRKLRGILRQDTKFLQEHGFLDYSMLLAIETSEVKFDANLAMQTKRVTRGLIKRTESVKPSHQETLARLANAQSLLKQRSPSEDWFEAMSKLKRVQTRTF
mmetsp:Transcript_20288/g.23937  ORF Transcript_20288/g.23937 Transcript_20288/m.23937 type:complete len:105 (+) Transcript_20288:63-377(+)